MMENVYELQYVNAKILTCSHLSYFKLFKLVIGPNERIIIISWWVH